MENYKHFAGYRMKDYVTPRSLREAYGWNASLHVEDSESWWAWLAYLLVLIIMLGLFGWSLYAH